MSDDESDDDLAAGALAALVLPDAGAGAEAAPARVRTRVVDGATLVSAVDVVRAITRRSRDYAGQIDPKVVLIDGQQLAGLMIDFDIGVAHAATYTIKRIDSDYFEEG